ncbi:TRAP-type C4-dicarboxylate transport system, small permease component [Alteribacillus persepolensis]|uniref:TRAP-type C4-dicarboxylate transport system, small permease component n=1 Tax=Alteribacillus persepolensis TaxID=568899 RepID=A0A1G8J799_9BACI|nr:TRAP transporter small permease [Alteribacillus persepolensis]SDI27124.1 TRAP-type C4-dicarboxylate transport system, small permease component [Alteribacillus persepolensis]
MQKIRNNEIYGGVNSEVIPEVEPVSPYKSTNEAVCEKINYHFNQGLAFVAGVSLALMMFLIVYNSVVRVFATPFVGTTEVAGWLMAVTTAFALGYTQFNHGHVDIKIVTDKLPTLGQKISSAVVQVMSLLFYAIVGWHVVTYGFELIINNSLSETMGVIFYPFVFVVALGFFGTAFTLIIQLYQTLTGEVRGGKNGS